MAVDVGTFNVLAGPNGSGKTTLLDIPGLLGELIAARRIADPFLESRPSAAPRAERLRNLVHRNRGDEFNLVVEACLPDAVRRATDPGGAITHLRYELRFQVLNEDVLEVLNEYLFGFAQNGRAPVKGGGLQGEPIELRKTTRPLLRDRDWRSIIHRDSGEPAAIFEEGETKPRLLAYRIPPTQLALANLPADMSLFPAAVWFADFLRDGTTFFQPETRALRRAAPPGRSSRLDETGANVARLAFDLQRSNPQRFRAWVDHVQTALPRISDVSVQEREDDRYVYLQVRYGDEYDVPASGLSEGTLRLLALTLLPYLEATPSILVTEEPENGVHPRAVEAILLSLQSIYDGQVWLSTHSPVVLAATPLESVLLSVLDNSGDATVVAGREHEKLVEWKGVVDLGTLFAAGVLG
jgi:energy-coupling factor transporter ATP-binding protein EcfA2